MKAPILMLFLLLSGTSLAQEPVLAPNAPKDKPVTTEGAQIDDIQRAIAPYIAQAKATYPDAKRKFLAGLPTGHSFFITTQLRRGNLVEQVFVAVRRIEGDTISGRIWSDVNLVPGYRHGDDYSLPESDIVDWLITHPDGSEEGNIVGKFLDGYRTR